MKNIITKLILLTLAIFGVAMGSILSAQKPVEATPMLAQETIVFAAGCFWGVEKHFDHFEGVISAESGYVGGNYKNPTYDDVVKYRRLDKNSKIVNYTEGVKVVFDTRKVDTATLIRSFWELHDPTQLNGQGNDIGNNYRSALFYKNEAQKQVALDTKKVYQSLLINAGYGQIVTEIEPLLKFYNAEKYHQDYLVKNPFGYCPNHATGVKFEKEMKKVLVTKPLGGKEIIVIGSPVFCPYCDKFEEDVSNSYKGTLPMRTVLASSLKGFDIETKIFATPTILFIEDGKEVIGHVGYMDKKLFYKTLGAFKLGKGSQAYQVAFHEGTDAPGCKQYKIFENTPDGVFIDKLSGEILFDTRDRFHSGTGWLSFYKAKDGAVIERDDSSFGMTRIALVSKTSGIHLGHVFPRADGRRRFCIDATVLEFVPRGDVK
ncbi:Peptide methionine sulfoxide reductase MsrA / Thiol:disulfide oxidoreductase associated with MetSO reductase / Peptide methionine sulfoxide reductase MsrB [hydrothermal vent metagenome]|uniref:peptide-methionine (S)-S-oxide reductase n=1 Tax=hydrothermal vent metagenome TaxID=652676 RepID=A0A1W1CM04_9ZZZZ